MKIHSYIFSLLACLVIALPGYSQVDRNETLIRSALHGLEYEIKAGFSIGGTAPLPLPVEIRSIDGYNPTLAISIVGIAAFIVFYVVFLFAIKKFDLKTPGREDDDDLEAEKNIELANDDYTAIAAKILEG